MAPSTTRRPPAAARRTRSCCCRTVRRRPATRGRAIRSLIDASGCDDRANDREECAIELAEWLKDGDASIDRAPILTHTIGFNFSSDFLRDVATAGGGRFQEASSASELAGVFKNIVDAAASLDTTFVAPSATVSQFNRLANRNDIYFSMFRPGLTTRWAGNLKRYELNIPPGGTEVKIVDALGNAAIDDATGDFRADARSFWTDGEADGADVARAAALPTSSRCRGRSTPTRARRRGRPR